MSDARRGRWNEEDLALLRTLGGRLSQIILGEDLDIPDLQRRDELGILANMVSRLARELRARRRDEHEHRRELERRVEELSAAYATQERLLTTIRSMPCPILTLHEGILLVPFSGAVDAARFGYMLPKLLDRVAAEHAAAVILHLAAPDPISPEGAALLAHAAQSLRKTGARPVLSGAPKPLPAAFASFTSCETLQEALTASLDLIGYRITR
jgi:rsbT co-antagonist protein RsbR